MIPITAFSVEILSIKYAVVFEDLRAIDKGSKYYAVELTFIDMQNENRKFSVRANAYGFNNTEDALEFFGINITGNSKYNPIFQIYKPLNASRPTVFSKHFDELNPYLIDKVNERDSSNGRGLCCYKAIRNPKPKKRTEFNTAKTRLLRPTLFDLLGKNEPTISFCYRKFDELSDVTIIANFNK